MALTTDDLTVIHARIQLARGRTDCGVVFSQDADHAAEYDVGCDGIVPLHLGMNVLRNLHLYLATEEKMLYFTGRDAAADAPASGTSPARH